jgi:hypothetical protein
MVFPEIAGAAFVVVDTDRADIGDELNPVEHAARVAELRRRTDFAPIFDRDGVLVFRRKAFVP